MNNKTLGISLLILGIVVGSFVTMGINQQDEQFEYMEKIGAREIGFDGEYKDYDKYYYPAQLQYHFDVPDVYEVPVECLEGWELEGSNCVSQSSEEKN